MIRQTLLTAAAAFALAVPASAAVRINITEVGQDVVESAFGSLDVSALFGPGTAPTQSYTASYLANIIMGPDTNLTPDPADHAMYYVGFEIVGPANFGTKGSFIPTSVSGDTFGTIITGFRDPRLIIVPHGYVSGTPIASGAVFANQTLALMGFTPGTYTYSWPSDSITIVIGGPSGAVPEPAAWVLMILGFGLAGAALRRLRTLVAA